jgi:hypothetical protein
MTLTLPVLRDLSLKNFVPFLGGLVTHVWIWLAFAASALEASSMPTTAAAVANTTAKRDNRRMLAPSPR